PDASRGYEPGGAAARGEDQPVVRTKQEGLRDSSQSAEASNQLPLPEPPPRFLNDHCETDPNPGARGHDNPSRAPGPPSDPERSRLDTTLRCPAFIRYRSYRGHGLRSRSKADGPSPHLPSHQLKNTLNSVLVEPQQVRDRPMAKGRMFFDQLLDRPC